MAQKRITDLVAASTLIGGELLEIAQVSTTVAMTATTLSALASDNSFNDSAAQFIAEGFAVADRVKVTGFTGDVANNILVGTITALTAGKMTIGGTDGDVIVDDAAGESVTIAKWTSRRATAADIVALGGGGAIEVEDEGVSIDAAVTKINFTGDVVVTQTAAGEIEVEVTGSGGGGGGAVGSHRYWRIYAIGTSSSAQAVACAELRFRSTPGGSNLAVTSSYCVEENGSFPSSNLYDGNFSNLWGVSAAASTPFCSLVFDLGSAVAVEEIMIAARNDSYFYQAPRSFTLAWSDDGIVFHDVASFELGEYTSAGAQKLASVPTTYP